MVPEAKVGAYDSSLHTDLFGQYQSIILGHAILLNDSKRTKAYIYWGINFHAIIFS